MNNKLKEHLYDILPIIIPIFNHKFNICIYTDVKRSKDNSPIDIVNNMKCDFLTLN
jgi:hypothetical protein